MASACYVQCKTCLGHDIDFNVLASVRPCLGHGVIILSHVRAIKYLVAFQMVQRKMYELYRNEKSYDHVCHLISSRIIGRQKHRSHYQPKYLI
ncbi:28S ribosomal S9, mitochondrial [Gossypium arboreum]|uniref:28S ribosomal S9, mitochondrial n=1 Tax=Gossypium arboreum TaxID=29729 RepID=A0A0B0NSJ3_GOSAR|nr:28S ribosomal S9, mitochondrial [Gossypium arboreum]